jgi:phosphoglycolate phosphatase
LIRTVLFDLDGTLLDTAPDLAWALNELRRRHGQPEMPFEQIRPSVSHGGLALIKTGFGLGPDQPDTEPLRQELLSIYSDNIARHTRPFPGMAELLDRLEQQHINWGVVTNKPAWLTNPLMQALGLAEQAVCIVSGDTLPERKPDPAPMLHACGLAGSQPQECLYVGDAQRDIEAGQRAGIMTVVALFGYIGPEDRPAEWGADVCVHTPMEILDWIQHLQAQ